MFCYLRDDALEHPPHLTLRRVALVTLVALGLLAGCKSNVSFNGGNADPPTADNGAGNGSNDSGGSSTQLAVSGEPPPEVVVEDEYSFRPETSGANGNPNFSVDNLPPWADFDPRTGELTGTPQPGDEAIYRNVTITVSDGSATATVGPFDIGVVTTGQYSVALAWQPPDERLDGSPLSDLDGYRIYYGRHDSDLNRSVEVDNPGLTSYVVDGLARGRWLFAMTAVDADGRESPRSASVAARAD